MKKWMVFIPFLIKYILFLNRHNPNDNCFPKHTFLDFLRKFLLLCPVIVYCLKAVWFFIVSFLILPEYFVHICLKVTHRKKSLMDRSGERRGLREQRLNSSNRSSGLISSSPVLLELYMWSIFISRLSSFYLEGFIQISFNKNRIRRWGCSSSGVPWKSDFTVCWSCMVSTLSWPFHVWFL